MSDLNLVTDNSNFATLDASQVDLETVLDAWHTATERLRQTHQTLSQEVRRLTDELEIKNRELARKNRLADLGQMASHVAHECRNSLVPITLYMSLLRRRVGGEAETIKIMNRIESGFTALESTVNDLLHFASDRQPDWCRCSLREAIDDVYQSLTPQFTAQAITVELDVDDEHLVEADATMIRRAVLNLILNALDVMADGGELSITSAEMPNAIEIEVADSGPGVADDVAVRLFEPFFTTKSDGTGLGLAIVERIASVHGGSVTCRNCPQGGAAFTLRIPKRLMEKVA